MQRIVKFIKEQRKARGMTQEECALKAGVSLWFVRTLEQGKESVQADKVNDILELFGCELGPVKKDKPTFD
jgi:y4mF family transcriptional regulator